MMNNGVHKFSQTQKVWSKMNDVKYEVTSIAIKVFMNPPLHGLGGIRQSNPVVLKHINILRSLPNRRCLERYPTLPQPICYSLTRRTNQNPDIYKPLLPITNKIKLDVLQLHLKWMIIDYTLYWVDEAIAEEEDKRTSFLKSGYNCLIFKRGANTFNTHWQQTWTWTIQFPPT
jgi:hypothetical protein